jgi:hypothetical protein
MYASEVLGQGILHHADINYVNTKERDIKLFIDPCLIEIDNDEISQEAMRTVNSYYDRLYTLYRNQRPDEEKLQLFLHAGEINDTKLGYGNGRNGHCKTPQGMIDTFRAIDGYLRAHINMTHPIDTAILIEGYAEDCLSDTLTNALWKVLNQFTIEECNRVGRQLSHTENERYYWDYNTNLWTSYVGDCLKRDNGEIVLLVPKIYVRQRFYYSVGHFISNVIFEHILRDNPIVRADGTERPYTRRELIQDIRQRGETRLGFTLDYLHEHPEALDEYHRDIPTYYFERDLSDDRLDAIVFGA